MLVSILVALFCALFTGALYVQEGESGPDNLFGAFFVPAALVGFAYGASQAAGFQSATCLPLALFSLSTGLLALIGPLLVLVVCRRQREASLRALHERQGRFYSHCLAHRRAPKGGQPAPVGWRFVQT